MHAQFRVIAPKREGFQGIRVGGYFWPTNPATVCTRIDSEGDEPADEGGRRIGRKTYAHLLAAQELGRVLVIADPGEQAAVDSKTIERLSGDLARAESALRDMTARAEVAERDLVIARGEAAQYRGAVTEAHTAAESATKRADEVQAKYDALVKAPEVKARAVSK